MKRLLLFFLCLIAASPAAAIENETIEGEWLSNENGIFIVPTSKDVEPIFLYGNCKHEAAAGKRAAQDYLVLNLDVEQKWIGPIIARDNYLIARFIGDGPPLDVSAESIWSNEASARTAWTTRLQPMSRPAVDYMAKSKSLSLSVGGKPSKIFETEVHYALPEKNKIAALNSFIKVCFGG